MGWQIDMFRVRAGQDPIKVREVQYGWASYEGYAIAEPSSDSDAWIDDVIRILRRHCPTLDVTHSSFRRSTTGRHMSAVRAHEAAGPSRFNIYPDSLDLSAKRAFTDETVDTFARWWEMCRDLAQHADCAVFPQGDDEPVDFDLALETARVVHNWI